MRLSLSLGQLAAVVLSVGPMTVAAWPTWGDIFPRVDSLVVRQQDIPPATASTTARAPASTGNLNTGSIATGTATQASGSNSGTTSPSHTVFDARGPAGMVVLQTPAPTLGLQLFKIGDFVTIGWNYTNVLGAPTAVDVLVTCSAASQTWTIGQNVSYTAGGQTVTWDTNGYQATAAAAPLLTQEYTLMIFDSDSSLSATAEAGYLAAFSSFTFGLYAPKKYTPLGEWTCATCSAAGPGGKEKRALGMMAVVATATVLGFTWFVTGVNVQL